MLDQCWSFFFFFVWFDFLEDGMKNGMDIFMICLRLTALVVWNDSKGHLARWVQVLAHRSFGNSVCRHKRQWFFFLSPTPWWLQAPPHVVFLQMFDHRC